MDEAGPLNGKIPPTLTSAAVTPGASAANAGDPSAKANAHASFHFLNILISPSDLPIGAGCSNCNVASWASSIAAAATDVCTKLAVAFSNTNELIGSRIEHIAEQFPTGAVPALKTHLRPKHIVRRTGVHFDVGQSGRKHHIPQRLGLPENVGARQIIAALFQDLLKQDALLIAGQIARVRDVRSRQI